MKVNPQQAPLYGHCVVTVQLTNEELAADDEGVDYFLLFAGSTQRHLTSTLRSSHDTLQALCPAHDCCEVVLVTLCSFTQDILDASEDPKSRPGRVAPLAEHRFRFVQDLAFDMAQFLVSTVGRVDGLDGVLLLDECQIPLQECERLDESLALALHHIVLPPGWSLLGSKRANSTDPSPQETLLHFSVRRGLSRVTRFLLRQTGAREALRLANREGHTPSAIAASRGLEGLHELLTKAETDAETDKEAETAQLASTDAWVSCHFPTLNTHTLTVKIHPGCDPPTIQKSVEHLIHLICHLHAKGVSVLELQLNSLHTAAECFDGVETDLTCQGQLQPESECLDAAAEGSGRENCTPESGNAVNCGHDEIGNVDKDLSSPLSAPTSEKCPREHGLGPPEDRVCLSSNSEGELCQAEQEEEEWREQCVGSSQSLSLCDGSEGAKGEAERESATVGILPAASCGKQAEEADTGKAAVREELGEEQSEQEAEDSTARTREEETGSKSTDLIAGGRDANTSVMGQVPSSECSEVSDASESETKECYQHEETVDEEVTKLIQELCDRLSLEEEEGEREELIDPVSTPRDLPNPSLVDCGGVIEEPQSAVPCVLIEGLHQGEPPPDINSQEQNQETAGGDYAVQQQQGLAPETGCHSGNCSGAVSSKELDSENEAEPSGIENPGFPLGEPENKAFQTAGNYMQETRNNLLNSELSSENMPTKRKADRDSGTAHGLSSDDEDSFRSFGSSSTEVFHPTQDYGSVEDQDLLQINVGDLCLAGSKTEDPNYVESNESNKHLLGVDERLLLEPGAIGSLDGSEPETQLSDNNRAAETFNPENKEKLTPELSKEDLSVSKDTKVHEGENGETNSCDLNVGIEYSSSTLSPMVQSEPDSSVRDESTVILPVEKDDPQTGTGEKSVEVAAGECGNVQFVSEQPKQHASDEAADESSAEKHLAVSSSEVADLSSLEVDAPATNSEAFTEPPSEDQMAETPKTHDTVDGASESSSATQELDVNKSEDTVSEAGEEESGPAEGTDSSTIHRDREASLHQPCNTQHSGSSPSSAFPSLSSRTSSTTSCPSSAHRDSGSDIESLLSTEPGYDSIFRKNDEAVTGGDSTSEVSVSCSSTDDTASVDPSSSSPEGSQGLGCNWSPEEGIQTGAANAAGLNSGGSGGGGDVEEEAKDRVTEVPRRSSLFRSSNRSLSPLRRHSWGPGKNNGGETEMNQRSSIRSPGEGKPAFHRRSISWCPPEAPHSTIEDVVSFRSYSLEGLSGGREELRGSIAQGPRILEPFRMPRQDSDDRGSLVSLTEEQEEREEHTRLHNPKLRRYRPLRNSCQSMSLPLTKSVSMLTISHKDIDGTRSFSSTSGSLAYSISEEEPGPLRSDTEGKSGTKVSRTFSYLKNKMYKKTREKDREKKEKDKEGKEKDKKTVNGHLFTAVGSGQAGQCSQCNKAFISKEALFCTYCNASVHKGCRDSLPVCAKVKMKLPKQQVAVPDSSSFPTVTMRNKSGGTRERPWSAILSPEDHSSLMVSSSRRHTSIMAFHGNNLSKSLSISNIAGPVLDEMPIKGLRYLSQSTDSLNRTNQVTESMESLTDEGTEMMDGQLMGEFEAEAKDLEADSWSLGVEQQYLQQLDKELVKRQDVIYELMQTEMHHIRTLRIMSEVYSKGLQKEVQLELQTVEKLFPALDELLELHSQHLLRLLERKKESHLEEGSFIISRIGDILVSQFSGSNGESMKKVYGRFCSRHNEAVNFYKDLLTKDRRFKAFIKKKMSSSIVRRLGIPECILLVTQRITKYPVLIQRMLQHTKESEEDYDDLTEAVRLVKEVIAAVDSKVNEHEKRRRLKDFHSRMDTKSIMMMKGGQIFAREDLLKRKLIHDGGLQLKNIQGRLKEVHALLLSDVLVFLQEKDQKYVFAMLDQRSTVISLQKLIVREVANKERGLFLITAGMEKPEMMEVLASSKDERNTWMQFIQEAMQSMEKDEDEGIPSETEDDKRQLETKAKEMRDMLRQKDTEIMSLLEEKVRLFRGMWEGLNPGEEACRQIEPFFRSACSQEPPRGASIMKDALQEVETLQALVNSSLGGAMASVHEGGGAGPVCLPRRAETFGGFDSHQMHSSGDRDESEDTAGDLRRTESDSVLKKGGNANLLQLLKRNSEQVLHSVSHLHLLLSTLQAVVVQQDSYIEDQRQALSERSSCALLSRQSSRPSSLIEQEKQRSLEKQRQELASLQRQQAAHAEEKRRREKEWELREQQLSHREALVHLQEEEITKLHKALDEEKQELQSKKEEYQRDLERLRDAQRKLEREREAMRRQLDKMEELRLSERTPSTTSDESLFLGSSQSLELDPLELSSSSSSSLPRLQPQSSKPKGKGLNPFTSSSANLKGSEANNQISKSFLQLAKNKNKDGKKKKKSKGGSAQTAETQHVAEPPMDGEIFFC
ncbi:A-kinase anchor protein 13 isoform X3 [Melanotaenia boesemani]|uniref:A-kinase anchor protein 13 isoform X3 n=1 Tax=Melanotaenia boesemani TaxID=1250792 RepID=UPI001C045000|nr:A-kinase anchor protein 13 isoform X3 [Melanotaenia boesemani]